MKILGIETSGLQGSIALLDDECPRKVARGDPERMPQIRLRREVNLKAGLVHGKYLIPSIKKALKYLKWQPNKLDLIAVDIGPGSYTGLRVGLATAKTLAYALKTNLVGVSSLDILAANIPPTRPEPERIGKAGLKRSNRVASGDKPRHEYIAPLIDAKWNQVYSALYEKQGNQYQRTSEYLAIKPEELLPRLPRGIFLFGDGLNRYRNILTRADIKTSVLKNIGIPRAVNVARLGRMSFLNGKRADPFKLVPLYLRLTEAEVKFKR